MAVKIEKKKKQTIFVIVKNPKDLVRLAEGGIVVKEVNVGNIHFADGKKQLTNYISIGEEDLIALRDLKDNYGVRFNTRTTPIGGDAGVVLDLNGYLEKNK